MHTERLISRTDFSTDLPGMTSRLHPPGLVNILPGENTVQHLSSECPSTDRDRGALQSAIVGALGCVSQDQMPIIRPMGDARQVAASPVTARDFYAGQVPSRVKELLEDSCRRRPWRNEKGGLTDTL
jgi:hypothetical protein